MRIDDLHYYITPSHQCSYLADQSARMIFVDPSYRVDEQLLSELSRNGFRRSGEFIYRPECLRCRQCLSCRVRVDAFKATSSQKKALRRNTDLVMTIRPTALYQDYHYALYARYIHHRHHDGDMYPPSLDQFEKFLVNSCMNSVFLEFWLADKLVCVAACDHLDDGLSAVYTFFDPEHSKRSLGVYAILQQLEYARRLNLTYVYLGYWVPHSPKMNYKIQYQPLEVLLDNQWQHFDQPLDDATIDRLGHALLTEPNLTRR